MRRPIVSSSSPLPQRRRAPIVALALPLTLAAAAWIGPRVARACSCSSPPPPAQALESADAVFEARPFSMSNDNRRARYVFDVDKVWKGDVGPRIEISTALHSATCGRGYQIGGRYVVYARKDPQTGAWTDNLCSRTRTSQSAAEDLRVLGPGRAPHEPASAPPPGPAGAEPTEPPRIDTPPPGPPPTEPSRRGCAMEKPHTTWGYAGLSWLVLAVAAGRRRAVRSGRVTP